MADTPQTADAAEAPQAPPAPPAQDEELKTSDDAAGAEKAKIKAQIQALKGKRAAAIEAHDAKQLKWTRLNIKRLKQKIR
jgi:hypothetical protein